MSEEKIKLRFPRFGVTEEELKERKKLAIRKATLNYRNKNIERYLEYQREMYLNRLNNDPKIKNEIKNEDVVKTKLRFPRVGVTEEELKERKKLATKKANLNYRNKNIEKYLEYQREMYLKRLNNDPKYQLMIALKSKEDNAIITYKKPGRPPKTQNVLID